MKWYSEYYKIHGVDPDCVSNEVFEQIRHNIKTKFSSSQPVVSLVVIAYNEEKNIPACLWSLSEMKSQYPMEIIGVNNNSKDRTAEIFERCGITPLLQDEFQSPGASRQCGLQHARGQYYFCIDADLIYPPTYVEGMMAELQKPGVVAISSRYRYMPDKEHSSISLWFYEIVRNLHLSLLALKRPEYAVRGAVFAHDLELGRKIGYRMDIFRGEDGSMAMNLMQYGKIKFVNKKSCTAAIGCSHLGKTSTLRSLLNRIKRHCIEIQGYFIKKKTSEDHPDNLVQRKED